MTPGAEIWFSKEGGFDNSCYSVKEIFYSFLYSSKWNPYKPNAQVGVSIPFHPGNERSPIDLHEPPLSSSFWLQQMIQSSPTSSFITHGHDWLRLDSDIQTHQTSKHRPTQTQTFRLRPQTDSDTQAHRHTSPDRIEEEEENVESGMRSESHGELVEKLVCVYQQCLLIQSWWSRDRFIWLDCKNNNFDMEPINVFQYIPTTTCINWHNFLTIQFLSLPVEHGNLVALALQWA